MKPFNREKFLLYMLAGIFTWQAALFTGGVIGCYRVGGKDACPSLGDRYENTVGIMVATTLALLGGNAVLGATQKPSASAPSSPSASQRPQPLQLPPESQTSFPKQSGPRRQSNSEPPVSPDRPRKGSGRKSARSQDRQEE